MKRPIALLALLIAAAGCVSNDGIIYTDTIDSNIANGIVHEVAELQLSTGHTLVVPEDATVVNDAARTNPTVMVTKELAVFGHPSERVSIKEMRHTLGVAQKATNDSLSLATFGEYAIEGHGGAQVALKILLPENVKWKRAPNLSGPNNATGPRNESDSLNEGWVKIQTRQ